MGEALASEKSGKKDIDLYYWPTPNGWKASIMLEEVGLEYEVVPVDIADGDQFEKDFLRISPNNKMPAIVDHDGVDSNGANEMSIFESGAILIYLAEKTGELYGESERERHLINQWLMFQMGSVGPMLGQAHHFRQYAPERIEYAYNRYTDEASRIYTVMDRRLEDHRYFAGEYSIADIAIFPWVVPHENQGQDLESYPNLRRWHQEIEQRPAAQRGMELGSDWRKPTKDMDEETRRTLFSNKLPGER